MTMVEVYLAVSNDYKPYFYFLQIPQSYQICPAPRDLQRFSLLGKTFQSCIKNAQLGANRTENP